MNIPATRNMTLIVLGTAAIEAHAQEWLLGGAIGIARQQDYEVGAPIATRDDKDTAFRLFGGYRLSPMQGVVASYVDLGTPRYDGPAFGGFADSLAADGVDLSYIAGFAPGDQQRFSLFGTVGIFHWNQDVTLTDASGTMEYADDGTSFSLGFGADINLSSDGTNAWSIHLAYQLFKDIGETENSGHEYDREMLSVGIGFRFGSGRD